MVISFKYLYSLWLMLSGAMVALQDFFSMRWSDLSNYLKDGSSVEVVLSEIVDILISVFGDLSVLEYMLSIGLVVTIIWGVVNLYWKIID